MIQFDGIISASAPILAFDGDEKYSAKVAGNHSYWGIVTKYFKLVNFGVIVQLIF